MTSVLSIVFSLPCLAGKSNPFSLAKTTPAGGHRHAAAIDHIQSFCLSVLQFYCVVGIWLQRYTADRQDRQTDGQTELLYICIAAHCNK